MAVRDIGVPMAATSPTIVSEESLLLRHAASGVATLTLNRPRQFNAISSRYS
jgi:enoyl-CoA hydratase/carnithine racemase